MNIWTKRLTEGLNDKGVCRTAPATPGLLNIYLAYEYETWEQSEHFQEQRVDIGAECGLKSRVKTR